MAKVQFIKKSRKEFRCKKCGAVIPVGSSYYRGEINFGPTIIRCSKCKLESWEVTTSDYQLRAGEILYKWAETYGVSEDTVQSVSDDLQSLCDDLQEKLDNMPEGLQEGDIGQLLQERIDNIDSAISELDCIDIDEIKSDVMSELFDTDADYDESLEKFRACKDGEEKVTNIENTFKEKVTEAIEEALSSIEI